MILDFSSSNFSVEQIKVQFPWEQKILNFILEFQNQKDNLTVRTSGSTGAPKSIQISKEAMRKSAQLTIQFLQLKKEDKALLCLPVDYIAGKLMVIRAMEARMKLICIEPKTNLSTDLKEIDFAALTPMQASSSLELAQKVNKLILGGASVSVELEKSLLGAKGMIYETYGMTETITHIALRRLNHSDFFELLPGVQIETDSRDCLVIQTPYFPDKIITNDVVEITDNKFKWLGRRDFVINSGGVKLFPEQIEKELSKFIHLPFVVIGIPNAVSGEKPVLVIESEKKINWNTSLVELPKYSIPKEIFYLPNFPKTESGKVKRKEIQKIITNT